MRQYSSRTPRISTAHHETTEAMTAPTPFHDYPATFASHSRASAPRYRICADCFAGRTGVAGFEGLTVLQLLADEGLSVFAGTPPAGDELAGLEPRPVYALSADDPPAVPTGRVFVQGKTEGSVAGAVTALGYVVESVPPYAPHAAWIIADNGSIATALSNLEALFELDAIVSAEPQMLRPTARR